MRQRSKPVLKKPAKDALPPHDTEVEQAALGCVILASEMDSQPEADALLLQMRPAMFYGSEERIIHATMTLLRMEKHACDTVMIVQRLRADKQPDQCWRLAAKLADVVVSIHNFHDYLSRLKDFALRRWTLAKQARLGELAHATELTPEQLREEFSEILEQSEKIGTSNKPLLDVVSPEEAKLYEPDETDFMVGRGLIMRGQVVCIGGAPGVGKSRLATTLALAGAGMAKEWQGYPVASQWRTLMIQTENNGFRLKEECDAIPKRFSNFIRITRDLPLGMAFGNPEFRRQLLAWYDRWPFELLTIDPLNDLVTEDGQTDFKMALQNIRQVFVGRRMPAICFVAHLRKSRGENGAVKPKSGRQLLSELSGTLAIGSTARAVFVVQPASSDMSDDRVVFEVAKSSDCKPDFFKEYGSRTAWHRANGAFEKVADFDWHAWDNPQPENEQRREVKPEMVKQILDGSDGMLMWELSKAISAEFEVGKSTVARALGEKGYLRHMLKPVAKGGFALKEA